tara:strand:+ start:210202 stop:210456 length:255 start_codon:yes stop_codon:yes gene_type:complete
MKPLTIFFIIFLVSITFVFGIKGLVVRKADQQKERERITIQRMENAYFKGQKDYAEGNIIIVKISDTTWGWINRPPNFKQSTDD